MYLRESNEIGAFGFGEPDAAEMSTFNSVVASIKAQLERKFQDPNDPRLYHRRKELVRLFRLVPSSLAKDFHARLLSSDPLGRLFRYRLHTATRKQLLGILAATPSAVPPKPVPSTTPPVPQPVPPQWNWPVWPWPPVPPAPPSQPPPKRPDPPTPVLPPVEFPPPPVLPDLSPPEIFDRVRKSLDYLKRNKADQKLIQKLENLLNKAAPILTLAGVVLGLFVFTKGRLVQVLAAKGMVEIRVLHRFLTSDMKGQLEQILKELTDPNTTAEIDKETRRIQQEQSQQQQSPESPLTKCRAQHPFALTCSEQFQTDPADVAAEYLTIVKGIPFTDIVDIGCSKFKSFGAGDIQECSGAPGETWHCTATIKEKGSTHQRVVSVFGCLCCRDDGSTGWEWRGPHLSPGG